MVVLATWNDRFRVDPAIARTRRSFVAHLNALQNAATAVDSVNAQSLSEMPRCMAYVFS